MLFVAHREQILEQSMRTFRRALRDPNFGEFLGGDRSDVTGRHVFAMVQTIANRLTSIPRDAYSIVYIDEAHHGTADTWRRTIEHFADADEVVGITATPERTDESDVAGLFGGAYATELRLWEAVDDQLLAPFNYIGIDDGTDLRSLAWTQGNYVQAALSEVLPPTKRVRVISDSIVRWVEDPTRMRALASACQCPHAQFMAQALARRGYGTAVLTGQDDQRRRRDVLAQLPEASCRSCSALTSSARASTYRTSTPSCSCGLRRAPWCSLSNSVAVFAFPRASRSSRCSTSLVNTAASTDSPTARRAARPFERLRGEPSCWRIHTPPRGLLDLDGSGRSRPCPSRL